MNYTTTLQQSICLFIALFTLSLAHGQMRQVKTKYGMYVNNQLEDKWYTDFLYNSPQQLYYLENKGYIKDSSGQFINNSKTLYTRDNLGRVTEQIGLSWDGNQWLNNNKSVRTYDLLGNTILIGEFNWEFGNWVEKIRNEWVYSSTNQLLKYTLQQGYNTPLMFHSKYEYEYDQQGRMKTEYYFYWNSTTSVWNAPSKKEYIYKNATTLIDTTYNSYWNSSQNKYILNGRYLYNYNASNQLITVLEQNYPNNQWSNVKKTDYQYQSSGLQARESVFNWVSNAWVLFYEDYFENDNLERISKKIWKDYDNTAMEAVNKFQYIYTYANDSSLLTEKIYGWSNNAWRENALYEHLFEPVQLTTSAENIISYSKVNAYPNPFTTNTIIEFESVKATEATIQIFDFSGRLVFDDSRYVISGTNAFLWEAKDKNGNTLPVGLFIVQIKTAEQLLTLKPIKQ